MSSQGSPGTAFALSLIGGILMLVSGGLSSMWFMSGSQGFGGMMGGGYGGMMGGYGGMMGGFGVPFGFMSGLSLLGLVSGILVIIGALMLNTRPAEHTTWGIIILIFSIISLLGMGGFFIGAILGIVGGALALSWRPSES
ncbi:MAG: DUF6114 domain-containing protein [Thaumarchaeota archaeon]|nr:DUF6114 domain-containing protein [Nitrososphaerota archaeon]MCL5317108.1 DUF6114 domain-containing protein [Nitrososphaerota archaeon]